MKVARRVRIQTRWSARLKMVAWAGFEHFRLGHQDSLDFAPRPRWPLAERNSQQTGMQI